MFSCSVLRASAILGLFAGMLLGKAIGSASDSREDPGLASGMMSTMGGFAGLPVGRGIRSANWSRVASGSVNVTPLLTATGAGLRVSLPDWR